LCEVRHGYDDRCCPLTDREKDTPGGIAPFELKTATLLSGDILYDRPLIEDTYHSNAEDYLASMERLLDIPTRIVHGGHFPSFSGERYRQLITDWLNNRQKHI
jgi:glyoxylase-like metal-dependent hydrolase (beta-lactamase superfamily II)